MPSDGASVVQSPAGNVLSNAVLTVVGVMPLAPLSEQHVCTRARSVHDGSYGG